MGVYRGDAPVEDKQARFGLPYRTGLPAPDVQLIGRDDAIAIGCGLLTNFRLVTLTGPGGIGKTQLALAIAQQIADRFPDGVAFIKLASITDYRLVLPTIAKTLGVWDAAAEPIVQRLASHLRERQLLLILDNTEHLLDAAPDIAVLLAASPLLHILVTSRSPLHLRGEHAFDVPPLAVPPEGNASSFEELKDYPSIELFVRQSQAAVATFALTAKNSRTIVDICTRLDGMPLAIELAASRIKVLSPSDILTRLDEQLELLVGGPRDQPPRLQTMRSAITWSFDLLDPDQQALFRHLAVFSGGWTLEAADAVCQPQGNMLEAMSSLITCSLVRRSTDPIGDSRFVMLEPIRQFALEQLVASGEEGAVRSRHADVYLALAEVAAPHLDWSDQASWMLRLDPEHDNFRAALSWLLDQSDAERGLRLVGALSWFWNIRGYFLESRTWAQAFLNLPPASERSSWRARALGTIAYSLYFLGDYTQARVFGDEALEINNETGDREGRARILIPLIITAFDSGDEQRHSQLSEDLLTTARDLGDQENVARALIRLGLGAMRHGESQRAVALYSESLEMAERLQNRATIGLALASLGDVYFQDGDLTRAAVAYRNSLAAYLDMQYARPIAHGLERLASVAFANGQAARSVRLYAAAAARCDAIGIDFPVSKRNVLDTDVVSLRTELGEEQFQSIWNIGRVAPISDAIAFAMETMPSPAIPLPSTTGKLSPRESEVLRLIASGHSNKQIAAELSLSVHTVERHITNFYAKIGARGRADATAWAIRHGLA